MVAKIKIHTPAKNTIRHTMGGVYCSEHCGADCTHEQYTAAYEACNAALLQMQEGGFNRDGQWQGRVWDNLGWRWNLTSGSGNGWQLSQDRSGQWECYSYSDVALPFQIWSKKHSSPIDAIREVISDMTRVVKIIEAERCKLTDGLL